MKPRKPSRKERARGSGGSGARATLAGKIAVREISKKHAALVEEIKAKESSGVIDADGRRELLILRGKIDKAKGL